MTKSEIVLSWFVNNIGKLTYSQTGSRNGSDGTADCSGSMSQALNDAYGGATLYSTISMHERLTTIGYKKVWSGKTTDARPNQYEVILTTSSSSMAGSGGDSGHIGMMMTDTKYISCTAVDWLGRGNFIKNNAIQICPWMAYKDVTRLQNYCEIWRLDESQIDQIVKTSEEEEMFILQAKDTGKCYLVAGSSVSYITSPARLANLQTYLTTKTTATQANVDSLLYQLGLKK